MTEVAGVQLAEPPPTVSPFRNNVPFYSAEDARSQHVQPERSLAERTRTALRGSEGNQGNLVCDLAEDYLTACGGSTSTCVVNAFTLGAWNTAAAGTDLSSLSVSPEKAFVDTVRKDLGAPATMGRSLSPSVRSCLHIAAVVAPRICRAAGVRHAAFAEEEGGASLVIHSAVTKREATLEFSPDGKTVTLVTIDEHMHLKQREIGLADDEPFREVVAWLKSRA